LVEDVARSVQVFTDGVRRRDLGKVLSIYASDAVFSPAWSDEAGRGMRRGAGEIKIAFENLFKDARHLSVSFRTQPSEATVHRIGKDHAAFAGYYKISKLLSTSIVEVHAKFVFVYSLGQGGSVEVVTHNSMLSPKGIVRVRGHLSKFNAYLAKREEEASSPSPSPS